jgi:luciferase family oxidoreductase group 1
MIPFSILDLSPIAVGKTASHALAQTLELAQAAERLGFQRFWVAEHHNMPGIASAATAVVIGHVAGGTQRIRVGAGGVMLPNHAPLVIAEQFGTLASLYPDRIDLGIGRAPGTDMHTAQALRRDVRAAVDQFPKDVVELQAYFAPEQAGQRIRAFPGTGLEVPIWLLGSSLYSAQLAAMLGLPFAFASHFAPDDLENALAIYRHRFQPSKHLAAPYAMLGINVFAADSDREARRQLTSQQQAFVNLIRGKPGQVPAPIDDIEAFWEPHEKALVESKLAHTIAGSSETVALGLRNFIAATGADELMISGHGFGAARVRSLEIIAQLRSG